MHEIKRVLNGLSQMNDRKQHRYLLDILQECSKISGEKYPHEMWSKDEIAAFLEDYREGNQKVAEEYLHETGTELFDDTIEDLPKWEKENPYMTDDLIRILGVVLARQHKEEQEQEKIKQSVWRIQHPVLPMLQRMKRKCNKT